MTAIETIALIIALVGITKVICLAINPRIWIGFGKKLWSNTIGFNIFAIIIALVVLKYLLVELTIVQIFAVFGFMAPFFWIAMSPYRKDMLELVERNLAQGNILKKNWFATLAWRILTVYVLKEIF